MKKHYILFIACCFAALSAWADDVTIVENYSSAPGGGATTTERIYTGNNFVWKYNYARTKTTDVVDTERAIWLTNHTDISEDQIGYFKTTLEGGLKAVAFSFKQGATADAGDHLYLSIDINGTEVDKKDGGVAVSQNAQVQSYSKADFDVKDNDISFAIKCTSTSTRTNPEHVGRILVGNVTITPYLLYTQKETSVGLQQHGFKNADLINNTSTGSISYSSSDETIARVNQSTGVITPVAVGDAVITAEWSEGVSTTYTLHVVAGILNENFSGVVQTGESGTTEREWTGAVCNWDVMHARRGSNDKVRNGKQCTWMTITTGCRGYLKTKNLEGGIKTVAFNYAQFGSEKGKVLKWKVSAIGSETISDEIERDGDDGENRTQTEGVEYTHNFNCAENAQLEILNASIMDNGSEPTSNARIMVSDIIITPYLLYTTKEATLDASGENSLSFKNEDLIDNTEATVEYSITNFVGIDEEKIAIAADGTVTVADHEQTGDVTIQAKWSEVTTTYTLHIIGNVYAVTFDAEYEHGSLSVYNVTGESYLSSGDEVKAGTVLRILPMGKTGYKVDELMVDDTPIEAQAGVYSYTMGAAAINVSATFIEDSGTSLDNTADDVKAIKVLKDGMLIIEKNGVQYNVLGTKL